MEKKIIIDKEYVKEKFGRENRNQRSFGGFHDNKHTRRYNSRIIETRLFTSRDELVQYVNEKGQSDAIIDIFKIEDELYKLVIKK